MFDWVKKLLGSSNDAEVKKLQKTVNAVEALEDEYKALTDEQLRAKTDEFRARLQNGETEDDILPEAFAAIREADARVLGMRPYRVQVMGGLVLHQGRIAEMKTGEGKTLVSTLPAYLNALSGKGVHVVTVNDYLARRDSEWMGKVHRFMGLRRPDRPRSGQRRTPRRLCLRHHLRHEQRAGLRLPARQHGHPPKRAGAARPQLRHRRRSGLHPD